MAFDVEGYRKAAKAAGFSDEDIEKDIAEETKGMASAAAPVDMKNVKVGEDFMGIPEWLQPALGLAGAAAAVTGAGIGINKLRNRQPKPEAAPRVEPAFGIPEVDTFGQPMAEKVAPVADVTDVASRPVGQPRAQLAGPNVPVEAPVAPPAAAPTTPTVAPAGTTPVATQQPSISGYGQQTLNAPTGAPSPIAPPTVAPVEPKPMSDLEKIKLEEAQIRLQATKDKAAFDAQVREKKLESLTSTAKKSVEKQQKGGGGLSPMDKTILNNQITAAAASDVKDTLAKKAAVPPAPATTAAPVATAPQAAAPVAPPAPPATPELETALGKPTVTTGSGMPAYAGQGGESAKMKKEFGSIADVPKGYVFVPGGQYMDITRNAVGQEAFTTKLGEFGGYPKTTEAAYEQSRAINKSLGRLSREEAKAAGVAVGDVTPSITKKVAGSKMVKVAGVGGALISLADVASAKEAAQTVGEMLLPIGATPSEVQPGTLTEKQLRAYAEAQKLGSPYRSVPPPR